jgi:glycosyltransferase involved in cell wall biosynthesis
VSAEKNLPMLAEAFGLLNRKRPNVELVVAGDGPHLNRMKEQLRDLPARFVGLQSDEQLRKLYCSSDLFVFPSRTDTLGQSVMEAQACGLPAIVSNEGGPKETVEHNVTGLVLASNDPLDWCNAILDLLDDPSRRQRMSDAAVHRMKGFSVERTFDSFWEDHLAIVEPPTDPAEVDAAPPAPVPV